MRYDILIYVVRRQRVKEVVAVNCENYLEHRPLWTNAESYLRKSKPGTYGYHCDMQS